MKKILCLLLVVFSLVCCNNGSDSKGADNAAKVPRGANETEQNIYRSGDSMVAAFKRKDWTSFVKYQHPAMVKMMGGPAAFASFVNQQMKQIPDTAIKSIELGKVLQVVKTPGDQQCVVEQKMKMILEGVDLSRTTYLIGESLDNGKTWTFLDATAESGVTPKSIKTDLSNELVIPATKKGQ